jgi:hypothetical protein
VRAVDAQHVHAGSQKVAHQQVVRCRFAGHGHHDAHRALAGRGTQQKLAVVIENDRSVIDAQLRQRRIAGLPGPASQGMQRHQKRIQRAQYLRFPAAQ